MRPVSGVTQNGFYRARVFYGLYDNDL